MTGTDRWTKKDLAAIVLCRRVNRASGTVWGCYPINYVLVVHMLALTTSAPGEGYEVFEDTASELTIILALILNMLNHRHHTVYVDRWGWLTTGSQVRSLPL